MLKQEATIINLNIRKSKLSSFYREVGYLDGFEAAIRFLEDLGEEDA